MLYFTGTAFNVQSLLGVIFMVGIVVSNTVLLIDFAQDLRDAKGSRPTEAIRKAACDSRATGRDDGPGGLFCVGARWLWPSSEGSEANAPLGRAVIGGLLAGLVTTLFVVPALTRCSCGTRMRNRTRTPRWERLHLDG